MMSQLQAVEPYAVSGMLLTVPWGRGDRREEVRRPAVRADQGVSPRPVGAPRSSGGSLYPDSFPRGFLEEAAELNFEGLELTWGE